MERIPYNTIKLRSANPSTEGNMHYIVPRVSEIEKAFGMPEVGRVGGGRAERALTDLMGEVGQRGSREAVDRIAREVSDRVMREVRAEGAERASRALSSLPIGARQTGLLGRSLQRMRSAVTGFQRIVFKGAVGLVFLTFMLPYAGDAINIALGFIAGASDEELAEMSIRICERLSRIHERFGSLGAAIEATRNDEAGLSDEDYVALLNAQQEEGDLFQRLEIALAARDGSCAEILLESLKAQRNILCQTFPSLCRKGSLLLWGGLILGAVILLPAVLKRSKG